jgi:hypothetical protein
MRGLNCKLIAMESFENRRRDVSPGDENGQKKAKVAVVGGMGLVSGRKFWCFAVLGGEGEEKRKGCAGGIRGVSSQF